MQNCRRRSRLYISVMIALAACLPVNAQKFEVKAGQGILQRPGEFFSLAGPGAELFSNDRINTDGDSKIDLWIDYRAGVLSIGHFSQLDLIQVSRRKGCAVATVEFKGGMGAKIKPFTCPFSVLRLISGNNGAFYTFKGTEAVLSTTGPESKVVVLSGKVEARQNKAKIDVPTGFGAVVSGQSDPELFPIDWEKSLKFKDRDGRYVGQINPLNSLLINDRPVRTPMGRFDIKKTDRGNGDRLTVVDSLGNRRTYLP